MRVVRVVMVLFGVAAVVLAILAVVHPRVASTVIVDLLPMPGDRAALLREDRDTGTPRWIETVGRNSSQVRLDFEARIPGNLRHVASLGTAGPVIVVRDAHGGIAGIDVESLAQRWYTTRLPGQVDDRGVGFALPMLDTLGTLDTLVEFWGHRDRPGLVVASDPMTGRERWRHDVADSEAGPAVIYRDSLALFEHPGFEILDLHTGATRTHIAAADHGCFAGDHALYRVATGAGTGELHVLSLASGTEHAVTPAPSLDPIPTGACFWHGDTIAAIVDTAPEPAGSLALVVYSASTGQEIHRLDLTGIPPLDPASEGRYAPDDDDVRFAPIIVRSGQHQFHVVMLDLEAGAIAWQGEPYADSGARVWFDHGHYYLASSSPAAITVLDGATGKAVARTCLPGVAHARFAGGRTWAYDDKQWALLDGTTLAKVTGDLPVHACPDAFGIP